MKFLKSHWSNIVFLVIIALLLIPQTRKPIQVGLNRLIAFGPSAISKEDRVVVSGYDWRLQDLSGKTINFEETKGQVTIVNFWATWCPPCIAEMPSFQSLYNDYGDKVNFYFVSSEEAEKQQRFIRKNNYTFPLYQPVSNVPGELESRSLPTTYVLGKNGEIVVDKAGSANWDSSGFRELLDGLLQE